MHTCVIGGTGFLGRQVVEQLLRQGCPVTVVGRAEGAVVPVPTRYLRGDISDREFVRRLCSEHARIVNLAYATVPQTSFSDPMYDMMSNLPPNVALFEEASRASLGRLLIVSSGGTVYGNPARLPLREDDATWPMSPYGITKLATEHYALMFHQLSALDVCIVRPANAYGAGQRAGTGQGFVAAAIAAILARRPVTVYGERGTVRDYVHVEDVAAGIIAALEHGKAGGLYNIGSGVGRDNIDVLDTLSSLAAAAGFSVDVRTAPARPFDVRANVLDCARLRAECGWIPRIDFADGMRLTWQGALESLPHGPR